MADMDWIRLDNFVYAYLFCKDDKKFINVKIKNTMSCNSFSLISTMRKDKSLSLNQDSN